MHPEDTLSYLEKVEIRNVGWANYVRQRAAEVARWIEAHRAFAAKSPETRVAALVTVSANGLQARLDAVLERC